MLLLKQMAFEMDGKYFVPFKIQLKILKESPIPSSAHEMMKKRWFNFFFFLLTETLEAQFSVR